MEMMWQVRNRQATYIFSGSSERDACEKVAQLFAPADSGGFELKNTHSIISALADEFLSATKITSSLDLVALLERFLESKIPVEGMDAGTYINQVAEDVVAHSTHTSSPRFIGHMTSALPHFTHAVSKLITAMNQNVVKLETAKAATPCERQAIAMLHRLIYGLGDNFYDDHIQNCESTLGTVVSGGTLANLTALWCARNSVLGPQKGFEGVEQEGLSAALEFYGYKDAVIVGSPFMHYSLDKASGILGIGTRNLIKVPVGAENRIDLVALRQVVEECRASKKKILAIIGIAGSTDCGSIDPLDEMATIARDSGAHFHVDAAWGGPILFSECHRHKLTGIERANSVAIDGHKQLYLPLGIGVVLFRDPGFAKVIEKQARYIVRAGSIDLGRRSLEGSRPAVSLLLHAALHILGRHGYEYLINEGMRKALYMVRRIASQREFQLLAEPQINIVNYRYIPKPLIDKAAAGKLCSDDDHLINQFNVRLQEAQSKAASSFVSRTTLDLIVEGRPRPVVSLRAILANPLTNESDIDFVLDDQVKIATSLPVKVWLEAEPGSV
jgi:putative pyridoxal-dependent aspartate 1-decarboxylase